MNMSPSLIALAPLLDSFHEWDHSTWPPSSKHDVFPASILFGFCITMHNPVLIDINGLYAFHLGHIISDNCFSVK